MTMIKYFFLSFLASCVFVSQLYAADNTNDTPTSSAQTTTNHYIDVGTPNTKKLRLAIPLFYLEKSTVVTKKNTLETTDRFKTILDFTGWFDFIADDAFLSKAPPAISPFQQKDWKLVQADFVLLGRFIPRKNQNYFDLELRAINVATQNTVAAKTYTNITLSSDLPLRDFGDIFIEAITGTPGPFMTQIAFVGRAFQNKNVSDIYVADFDGGHAYPITKNNTINLSPAWSPDGKKITYTSFKTGKAEIFEYNLKTKQTKQITFENANSSGSNWNRTGDLIAFSSSTSDGSTHIYTITGAGDTKEPLVTSSTIAVEPAFSPNGVYLAYTSNKFSKPMIFLYNFENNQVTRLTYTGWYNASAAWNPDSDKIAYASFDREIDRWDLFKINVDGSSLERLTLKEGDNEKPSWSSDGRFIMFQSNRGNPPNQNIIKGNPYKLYVMSSDGTSTKPLFTTVYDARQPAWGPRLPSE